MQKMQKFSCVCKVNFEAFKKIKIKLDGGQRGIRTLEARKDLHP